MSDILENEGSECGSATNFIHDIIDEDMREGVCDTVHTRFPPEPNGYLHIGSAKAIWINSSTAKKYGGLFNLRYDDTNPMKESDEYVRSIYEDLCWLGAEPNGGVYYGSDYFEQCYEYAVKLIRDGNAYVCDLSREDLERYRGDADDYSDKGIVSPYRERPIEESLDLFRRMKEGEFSDGARTLRAKIDPNSDNSYLRDPVIYRIRHVHHHRQGDAWCIYPMYDFAHPIQDALEGITHSLCSLEFEAHRPLYDWVVNNVSVPNHPRQIEFARLGIDHTVMSKRKLRQLVEQNYVSGWDDPRMPTLCGLRRRGYTSHSIRDFCERIGVAKSANTVEYALLEHCLREDLNDTAERTMAVLRPVKLVITNYPEDKTETFEVENNPVHPEQGTHPVTFSREVWIEAEDFLPEPIPKYKRLYPNGPECRLKGAYLITCTGCKQAADGSIEEIYATYDPDSRGGDPADGRKVKGATIHWVDSKTAVDAEVRLYGNLFSDAQPDGPDKNFLDCLNPDSLQVLTGCKVEAALVEEAKKYDAEGEGRMAHTAPGFQFMRVGYFCMDSRDCRADHLVFNRSVLLKDSFKPGK